MLMMSRGANETRADVSSSQLADAGADRIPALCVA